MARKRRGSVRASRMVRVPGSRIMRERSGGVVRAWGEPANRLAKPSQKRQGRQGEKGQHPAAKRRKPNARTFQRYMR